MAHLGARVRVFEESSDSDAFGESSQKGKKPRLTRPGNGFFSHLEDEDPGTQELDSEAFLTAALMSKMEDMKGLIDVLKDKVTSDLEDMQGRLGVLTSDLENVKEQISDFKDQVASKEQLNALGDDLQKLIHYIKDEKSAGLLTRLFRGFLRRVSSTDSSAEGGPVISPGPKSDVAEPPDFIISDLTASSEAVAISVVGGQGSESFPKFRYVPVNFICKKATTETVSSCPWRDCLSRASPCACVYETGGQYVYTAEGLLKEDFLNQRMSSDKKYYCLDCPSERYVPGYCKGHLIRKFIKECCQCGCDMTCGNRVMQRGIACRLQVFQTTGKGWGVRTLDVLEKGTFVCEFAGELLTNNELYDRNMKSKGSKGHKYSVTLDAGWCLKPHIGDEDALCLDATLWANVARFINHRCSDGNLVDIPVQVEPRDSSYYRVAFFTTRKVAAFEELTWDYGLDFESDHPIEVFECMCGSELCRDQKEKGNRSESRMTL